MKNRSRIQRIHNVTALIALTTLIFYLFFQKNKGGPFRAINPFAEDPYDAVGSFAIQGALFIGLLTYARALRLRVDPPQAVKIRLIQRGNLLVLSAILVTLFTDGIAVILHPISPSYWGNILRVELVCIFLLALICILALIAVFWRMPTAIPPNDLTPADAIDDLWTLVRVLVTGFNAVLPRPVVEWVRRFNSDWFFACVPWVNPRLHHWRFACILGIFVGVCLVLAQLQEGLPPDLQTGLLVAVIFISAEFAATLTGFVLFGGYLGLRSSLRWLSS